LATKQDLIFAICSSRCATSFNAITCATLRRLPADDPAHCGLVTQALGVVDILVLRDTTEHGLAQHADQRMTPFFPVRASASASLARSLNPSA
jgi:hypothetical protein